MMIEDVTYRDENVYQCVASDLVDQLTSQMYLQVHEEIEPFIRMTTRDNYKHILRNEGDLFVWTIDVEAYPPPQVKWFYPDGDEIPKTLWPSPKNRIISDNACCVPVLTIYDLDINDMGVYSVVADNQYIQESLDFTLEFLAAPKVYIRKQRTYYFQNQVDDIECRVEAYPKPNVTWTYRKCPDYHSCEDATPEYLTDTRENASQIYLLSTVTTAIDMSGELTCSACNTVGCGNITESVTVSDKFGEFGIVRTIDPVAEGDDWVLICAASIQNFSDSLTWSSKSGPIIESDRINIDRESTKFAYRSILKILNVAVEDSQEYICTGKSADNLIQSAGYHLVVNVLRAPTIINTNLKQDEIVIDISSRDTGKVHFYCYVDGMPKPKVTWFKDDQQLVLHKEKYKYFNNAQQLELIFPLDENSSGKYACRVENRVGKVDAFQRIAIIGFRIVTSIPVGVIILLVVLAVIVAILVIYFLIKIRRERLNRKELMKAGLMHFEKGAIESLNPDLTVEDQADLLPYDKKWEFPSDRLKLGKQLGSGAFGVVLKAEAVGICEGESVTTVAVKMVRRGPNLLYISALASELKIMIHLGKHLNIVNLLGACTKNILKRELLVIVEFCRFGNLHDYMLKNRNGFINQIDPASGKLDFGINHDLLKKAVNPPSDGKNYNSKSDSLPRQATATDFQKFRMSADDPVLGSTQCASSSCRGDYKVSNLKPICTQDLLSWAFQVARGMEYLSQRRILHGDLATRNILLADDNVAKICDFGLAKSMYKREIYKKKSDCPLPIKWLAIETMRDRIFSTQSDVWSFGIVLWEFFTLAETPYPGIQAEMVYQKLMEGYRMEKPVYAISKVYDIMRQCWKSEPSSRPSFTQLVDSVGNLLEDNVRAHYIELNTPYMDMNRTRMEGGMNDYLTMVSPPDHVVLSPPTQMSTNFNAFQATAESGCLRTDPVDAIELSPMLNKNDDDSYLKPISTHKR
ncbi:vascular endothelial growth factor receptor kdr-like [Augochlora pura]